MLSILQRYNWHQFSVVTSKIAGHTDFVQAVRERIVEMEETFKFNLLSAIMWTKKSDLEKLSNSDSRIILLYSTKQEAGNILRDAREFKLTGANYVWVVTQSVIENLKVPSDFMVGMIGVHFKTDTKTVAREIANVIKIYAYAVQEFTYENNDIRSLLNPNLSCEEVGESRWSVGETLFK